jgi:hypothetical protein
MGSGVPFSCGAVLKIDFDGSGINKIGSSMHKVNALSVPVVAARRALPLPPLPPPSTIKSYLLGIPVSIAS